MIDIGCGDHCSVTQLRTRVVWWWSDGCSKLAWSPSDASPTNCGSSRAVRVTAHLSQLHLHLAEVRPTVHAAILYPVMLSGRQRASAVASDAGEAARVVDHVISGPASRVVAYPHDHLFRLYRLKTADTSM